jgi:hypothetical protein
MHRKENKAWFYFYSTALLLILFQTTGFSAFSEDDVNKTAEKKDTTTIHSPHKATVYSAIVPGLGQIYNKKYWKVPLIYGGFVTLGYFINYNNDVYQTYKRAYSDIIDSDPFTNSYLELDIPPSFFEPENLTELTESVKKAKDSWRRNRDLVIIGTVVFYALNVIDASVDAHLFNFDIGDDLAVNWAPGPIMCNENRALGLQCRIKF